MAISLQDQNAKLQNELLQRQMARDNASVAQNKTAAITSAVTGTLSSLGGSQDPATLESESDFLIGSAFQSAASSAGLASSLYMATVLGGPAAWAVGGAMFLGNMLLSSSRRKTQQEAMRRQKIRAWKQAVDRYKGALKGEKSKVVKRLSAVVDARLGGAVLDLKELARQKARGLTQATMRSTGVKKVTAQRQLAGQRGQVYAIMEATNEKLLRRTELLGQAKTALQSEIDAERRTLGDIRTGHFNRFEDVMSELENV